MGSAGLEFDSNDQPSAARLNQKTTFVGTTAQIAALGTTYAGQLAYDTDLDTLYVRNAANSAWNEVHLITDNITETSEANTTPVTTNATWTSGGTPLVAATRYYSHFTLPTTEPLYIITGIEWSNGTTPAGNVTCGVDIINADPPTVDSTPLVAYGNNIAQSGSDTTQRNSQIIGQPIRGGTILGAWVAFSSASAEVKYKNDSDSQKRQKATAAAENETPTALNATAFATATTNEVYLKVYYRGYY